MTLLQLRYAVALERHGHFRLAAEACHVTQPALSAGVQALEAELGAVLFDRTSHPITPTALGRRVVAQGRVVLAEAERLEDLVGEATGELAGELRIGILSTLAPYLIPLAIAPFARRYPGVTLVFEELVAEKIIEGVRRDLLDAGLVATSPPGRGRRRGAAVRGAARGLRRARPPALRPATRSGWRTSARTTSGSCARATASARRRSTCSPAAAPAVPLAEAVQFESGNLETLQRIVDRGYGMTLLPWLAVQGQGSHAPDVGPPVPRAGPVADGPADLRDDARAPPPRAGVRGRGRAGRRGRAARRGDAARA